jgi:photosystem II stability/assembly factor-like uncharacterized protein
MSDHSPETNKEALTTRYADLLDAQADTDELQLIDDLETLYTSARVPGRLIAEGLQGLEEPGRPQGSPLPYTATPSSVGVRVPAGSPKRSWLNRLNALAAVLIAALLVGSLLAVTHIAQHSQQGNGSEPTTAPQCVQTGAPKSNAWLNSLFMMTTTTGWAVGVDHSYATAPFHVVESDRILHTTDGGRTWQDVTPPHMNDGATLPSHQASFPGDPYFLNFLNACSAWIVIAQPGNAPARLFHTNNGGATWQQTTLPGSQIRGIDFIDAHVGWLMVDVLKNSKFSEEDFYHSLDGGQRWTKIAISSSETDNQPGALPFANADNNFTFINANTGWITGALNTNNNPRLYITHDGGRTWHQQILPPPGTDSRIFKSGTVVWRPQFFSASDGILPVSFWAANELDVYVTHDGGNSWQSTSLLRIPMPPNLDIAAPTPEPDFVDVNHGWISGWYGTPLYATGDGGKHWTKIVPRPNLQYIALYDYDFVTNKTGWALGAITHSTPGPESPPLFKTEDGGKTWIYTGRG